MPKLLGGMMKTLMGASKTLISFINVKMGTFMYSVFTALGVCLIGGGLALQILYIENYQNDFQNYVPHQFASIILNTLVVCYLLFSLMYYRSYSSDMSMAAAVLSLLIGLAMEIFLLNLMNLLLIKDYLIHLLF